MLTTIHITVRDRVPTITAGEEVISHNSDYVAEFEFDEEWQDKVKTVYFVCEDGSYQAVVMSGNSCGVPMLDGEHRRIFVGVQAGAAEKPSILKTTRPCCLKVKDSIADYLGQPIPDPTPDVYQQIMALLEDIKQGEVSPEDIQKAVDNYLTENPISVDIATTEKAGIVTVGKNLSITKDGVLSVDTTDDVTQDNTKPITSAGVNLVVGNINALLAII
nr:MAG TPA: Paired amphipathic helix protein [Caudoviricetes sp.]